MLDGASSPEALVEEAARLGLSALALTDHDSLAGAVRFWATARRIDPLAHNLLFERFLSDDKFTMPDGWPGRSMHRLGSSCGVLRAA